MLVLLVTDLKEGKVYHFEVLAMSFDDHLSGDERISVTVPTYKKMKAIAIGLVTAVAFVSAVFAGVYYIKKKWCPSYHNSKMTEN